MKCAEDKNRYIFKEYKQMTNKHMERYTAS